MEKGLFEVVLRHSRAYPDMESADYVKLLYQNEFGCAHFSSCSTCGIERLRQEYDSLPPQNRAVGLNQRVEPIGNGLCRFFLTSGHETEQFLPLLYLMCCATAKTHIGSQTRFYEKLKLLKGMAEKNLLCVQKDVMESFLNQYIHSGGGPVHHSRRYKQKYEPHYRVVKAAYCDYLPIFQAVMRLLNTHTGQSPVILAVDGRCGSGKSFVADRLAEVFGGSVFHMDDFYLPVACRDEDWMSQPAGNIDRARFLREVLLPLKNGEQITYRPYSCHEGTMLPQRKVSPGRLAIVEGSYSLHPEFRDCYDYQVFLTCSPNVQQRRIFLRSNGQYLHNFLETWIPLEEQYIAEMHIMDICDLILDTSNFKSGDAPCPGSFLGKLDGGIQNIYVLS